MLNQLYDDRYAPITKEIGFLECDAAKAATAFQEWQLPIQSGRGVRLKRRELIGNFPEKIDHLLPLTSHEGRRFLFLPTASKWTAYLDSGWRGTDAFSTVSYLATTISCRGIRAVSVPQTKRNTPAGELGRYGATILEVYAATPSSCSFLNVQRSVFAANDGGRWKFGANGQPFDFEDLQRYKVRQIRDRFTPEMLDDYLGHFGIHFFSPDFYNVVQPAFLINKEGPVADGLKEYSLEEARTSF